MPENLGESLGSNEKGIDGIKDILDSLQKETIRTNFFKKAGDWLKKQLGIGNDKENETKDQPDKEDKSTNNQGKDKALENQEGLDKEKKTYTNAKSGLTYNCIDQVLDPAGSLKYPKKKETVADIGCLLASGCTITSAFSPSVTLKDCFNNVRHWTADKAVPKMSDNKRKSEALLEGEHGNRTKAQEQQAQAKIEENLEKGYPAIIGARHKGIDGINSSIVSQHYRAILDMRTQNGKKEFFVGNTYKNGTGGRLSEDKIFKNMIHASIFKPSAA